MVLRERFGSVLRDRVPGERTLRRGWMVLLRGWMLLEREVGEVRRLPFRPDAVDRALRLVTTGFRSDIAFWFGCTRCLGANLGSMPASLKEGDLGTP